MKLLVTSDLHLSDRIWKHRPIEGDSYHSWQQVVDLAIDHNVDAVILAGDILDKQANLATPVQRLAQGLARLHEREINVLYNQGQHEYQAQPWVSLSSTTVWLHENHIQTREGWKISGCDYQNEEKLQAFLKHPSLEETDILVCHQVWLEFMGEIGKPQGAFTDIPANIEYLITGDYHEHICKKFGELVVLSPGSTHLRSIAEPADKFVFLMELGNRDEKPKIQSLPLYTRRVIDVSTKQHPSFAKLKEHTQCLVDSAIEYVDEHKLPISLYMPLIRLTHESEQTDIVNEFQKTFAATGHLFYKQYRTTETVNDGAEMLKHLDASDRVGMLNCLDNYVDQKEKPKNYGLALALLQSPDPEQALHRWIQEQLNAG